MVRIRLKGRLGNQLFIYGFARLLCEKYHMKALLYDRSDEKDTVWHSHLNRFVLHPSVSFTNKKEEVLKMPLSAKAAFFIDRLQCKYETNRRMHERQINKMPANIKKGLFLLMDGYYELPPDIPKDLFCDGYFQSPGYLDPVRHRLLNEIVPRDKFTEKEQKFMDQIKSCESVCLTIRLGDYLGNTVHQVCTREYYMRAMDMMAERKPGCRFFVFSDEIEAAGKMFRFRYPVSYDSGRSKDSISLAVMSKCKHFIISNSSFSWWAQYLSQNPEKIVISPDRWYAQDIPCDIMQKEWVRIQC